jgi:hypothetical protein
MRVKKVMKVPLDYVYTFPCHIDSLKMYYHDGKGWKELKPLWKKVEEEWGGHGSECGGSKYWLVFGMNGADILTIDYQYQVCVPTEPSIRNYARTDVKFVRVGDVKIIDCQGNETVFKVRYLDEFTEQIEILVD